VWYKPAMGVMVKFCDRVVRFKTLFQLFFWYLGYSLLVVVGPLRLLSLLNEGSAFGDEMKLAEEMAETLVTKYSTTALYVIYGSTRDGNRVRHSLL